MRIEFWEDKRRVDPGIEPIIADTLGFPDPHQGHSVLLIHWTDLLGAAPGRVAAAIIIACSHQFSMTMSQEYDICARL
jgi:hypothetical protein